jgi:3D (Asp-Asp-Asp) domain-containing protein
MEALKKNHNKLISAKKAKKIIILLIFMLCFDFILFAVPVLASEAVEGEDIANINKNIIITENNKINLSKNTDLAVKSIGKHIITAYNSDPTQTDNTPCITANGFNLCEYGIEDTVAANFLPFGTKIRIPELFGDRVFIVRDRMNPRYRDRLDIWMINKADAKQFGVKSAIVEVLE